MSLHADVVTSNLTTASAVPTTGDAVSESEAFAPMAETGVLAVLPHPDDETFATGGTLALCADAGVPVLYLCGTYGDMGRRMGRPAFATRESLRDLRTLELREACKVLGIGLRFLGMRDKCIEFEDPVVVASKVRDVIEELRPSTVITYYPGHGVHPDHDALGHTTVLAVRGLPADARPRLLAVAVGDRAALTAELGEPTVTSDIRSVSERKVAALKAHRTQTEAMFRHWEEDEAKTAVVAGPQATDGAEVSSGGSKGKADPDHHMREFREEALVRERFYRLDPDARTLVEQVAR